MLQHLLFAFLFCICYTQAQLSRTVNSILSSNSTHSITSVIDGFTTLRPTNNTQSYYTNNFYSGIVQPPLSGVVQWNYSAATSNTTITLIVTNVPNGNYSLQLREYGNLINQSYGEIFNSNKKHNDGTCSYYIGHFTINQLYMNQSSIYTFTNSAIDLNGTASIIGRSALIINDTAVSVLSGTSPSCSYIDTAYDIATVVADGVVGLANPNEVDEDNIAIQPNVNSNTSTIADLIPSSLYYFSGYSSNECLTYNTTTEQTGQLLCNTSIPQQYFTLQPTTLNSSTFQLLNFITGQCWSLNNNVAPEIQSTAAPSNADLLPQAEIFNAYSGNTILSVECNVSDSTQYWSIDLTQPFTQIKNPATDLCFYSYSSEAGGVIPCDIYDVSQAWATHLLPQVEQFSGSVQYYTSNNQIYQLVNISGLIPYSQIGLFLTTYAVDPDASNALSALMSQAVNTKTFSNTNNSHAATSAPTTISTSSPTTLQGTPGPSLNVTTYNDSTDSTQKGTVMVPTSLRRLQQLPQTTSSASPGQPESTVPPTSNSTTIPSTITPDTFATSAAQISNTSTIVGNQQSTTNSTLSFTADQYGSIHSNVVVGNVVINNSTQNIIGRGILIQYISVPSVPSDNSSLLYSAANSYLAFGAVGINNGIS